MQDSNPPRGEWLGLYLEQIPQDDTAWSRLQAETLRECTYEHQATPMSGAKPVTLGQGHSTLAWLPQVQGSWALLLLHERITSAEPPIEKAVAQLRQVCQKVTTRPLSLWDAEYGCAPFLLKTAELACDKLIRLRSNRVLYGAPPPYTGTGRPRKHGDKFKLNEPTSGWQPDEEQSVEDDKWGPLRLQIWHDLHLRQAATQGLSLIRVERVSSSTALPLKPLWLIWVCPC